jgi:hypothetical protein
MPGKKKGKKALEQNNDSNWLWSALTETSERERNCWKKGKRESKVDID